jgi:hypothetical protein
LQPLVDLVGQFLTVDGCGDAHLTQTMIMLYHSMAATTVPPGRLGINSSASVIALKIDASLLHLHNLRVTVAPRSGSSATVKQTGCSKPLQHIPLPEFSSIFWRFHQIILF